MTENALNVVGQSVLRRDGLGHVTGKTVYIDDIQFQDMLHMKLVRSPVPHARIHALDFSEAEKVPGFVRALTHEDVPKNIYTILTLIGVGPDGAGEGVADFARAVHGTYRGLTPGRWLDQFLSEMGRGGCPVTTSDCTLALLERR